MSQDDSTDWRQLCRDLRVDPAEIEVVYSRYAAYRRFAAEGQGADIPLDQWFRFYHFEKASEGEQTSGPAAGCSIDDAAANNACIHRPGEFLTVLKAYVASEGG